MNRASRGHTAFAAAVMLFGLTLASCGTNTASSPVPNGTSAFCAVIGATNDRVDAATTQITRTASPQTVQSALDTIVSQFKTALDASPPPAVKGDLQTVYDTMVAARGEFAAVSYHTTQLPRGPAAVKDPRFGQAAQGVAQWLHINCGTPPQSGSSQPPTKPTR